MQMRKFYCVTIHGDPERQECIVGIYSVGYCHGLSPASN